MDSVSTSRLRREIEVSVWLVPSKFMTFIIRLAPLAIKDEGIVKTLGNK